jgi:hypothetical protein
MTNFNDPAGIGIEEIAIPARAYYLLRKLAEVKNRTVEELIEELILKGIVSLLENHSVLGEQYAQYLKERYQYDPQGRWKV